MPDTKMAIIDKITVKKAAVHNLKNIDVTIPKNKLTVITGPSGSGKSSLAFDTIYVEGQRRYIESLSSYARQFLGQFNPPEVESISGLSPAIAIDQKSTSKNPRSTVGTVTEIYDYLRVLYARIGKKHCPQCSGGISGQSSSAISKAIGAYPDKTKVQILAPIVKNKKGEHKEIFSKYLSMGFNKVYLNGSLQELSTDLAVNKNKRNVIDLVVDRLLIKKGNEKRISDSVELALKLAQGDLKVLKGESYEYFSENNVCHKCDLSFPELSPRHFSFNSPLGACDMCKGLGETQSFSEKRLVLDPALSLFDGAIPLVNSHSFLSCMIKSIFKTEGVKAQTPYNKLPKRFKAILLEGSDKIYTYKFKSENSTFNFKKSFPGIERWLLKKYNETHSERKKAKLLQYMAISLCPQCKGSRLKSFSLATTIDKKNIMQACELSISESFNFFKKLKLSKQEGLISDKLLKEINNRLKFLLNVGLDYLTLSRSSRALSGGESQRIRLATQIGSALTGVLYVLDEPSIGLHQKDNQKLIQTLKDLKNIGNTVVVVEHDEETMLASDHIIDMGPGAGHKGGQVVALGPYAKIVKNKKSLTGQYLSGAKSVEVPSARRELIDEIVLKGANKHNLRKIDLHLPLGGLVCITGVSGSGKSTLIHETLVPAIRNVLDKKHDNSLDGFQSITGVVHIKSLIELDQSPIGRTPKSNPTTYSNAFDPIRNLFSLLPESKIRGYRAGRFSFNVKGGRCEVCEGNGVKKIEMHFLPDVFVICDECKGKRYNQETLSVLYRGMSIFDILEMSINEACDFFQNHPKIYKILSTLQSVGLGYMKLGQPAPTLSGGEAQRLKLSRELGKTPRGHCLYILDEPTTGLHFGDIAILLKALNDLIEKGHSVLVIEHNLDVIKTADYVIDLGPEGGVRGGGIVAQGTPEKVAKCKSSYTGQFLKKIL